MTDIIITGVKATFCEPGCLIKWKARGLGFGRITLRADPTGRLVIDSEYTSNEFVKVVLGYLVDNAEFTEEI